MERKFIKWFFIGFAIIFALALIKFFVFGLLYPCIIDGRDYSNSREEISWEELGFLSEKECRAMDYSWVGIPGLCIGDDGNETRCGDRCDIPTSDAGNECYSNADCEGACLCQSPVTKDLFGNTIGVCSKYVFFTEVSDCPCVFEEKTTEDYVTPYGCA